MGKAFRRTSVLGATVAAATALTMSAGPAMAQTDAYHDDADYNWSGLVDSDGNYNVYRAAGRDRVETAIQLMCEATDHEWNRVIIARSDDFADALTSGPLADVTDAALLIMPSGSVDARVVAAINEGCGGNDFQGITLIGGTGVWSEANRAALEAATGLPVNRVAGIDRYDTAVAIAQRVALAVAGEGPHTPRTVNAYVATGTNFPDALAAGAAAAANDGVVLLTKGDKMNPATDRTYAFLDGELEWMPALIGHVEIHAVGGPAAAALADGDVRVDASHVGTDRYDTAVKLAETYAQTAESYTIASGQNYPDAVVSGAFAANHDGPLLLTHESYLTGVTRDYLRKSSNLSADVMVVGGIGSVSRAVSEQVMEALLF